MNFDPNGHPHWKKTKKMATRMKAEKHINIDSTGVAISHGILVESHNIKLRRKMEVNHTLTSKLNRDVGMFSGPA